MSRHITVIEDDPLVQGLIRDVLESEGDTVLTVAHGGTAQAILDPTETDLILVDMMLPDMPGTQLAAALREKGCAHIPVIAMSADDVNLVFAKRSALFQDAIRKPFHIDELLDIVERHAGRYVTA